MDLPRQNRQDMRNIIDRLKTIILKAIRQEIIRLKAVGLGIILCPAAAVFPADFANAQDVRHTYTLKECMQYAVDNSVRTAISEADRDDEQLARRNAILQAFTPSISANSYAYYNFGRSVDPETNTYKSTTSFNNGYSLSAGVMLFNGFEAVNNMKIAKTSMLMGASYDRQIRDEICLATMQAYYNVVYYARMAEALQHEVEAAESSLQLARRREELGRTGRADVIQIESVLAEKEYRLTDMQNRLAAAYMTLKDVMFYPSSHNLSIDLSMADEDLDPDIILGKALFEEESAVGIAITHNPAIAIARGELSNAKTALNTAKWRLLPSLSFNAGWSTNYFTYPNNPGYVPSSFAGQFRNNSGEYLQLSLSIPIYGRLQRQSDIRRMKNACTRAEARLAMQTREVESEVRRALYDKNGAAAAFLRADKRAEVERQAYSFNRKKFEQGMISPIEYRTASANYLNAKAERLDALLQYYIKRSVAEYYGGTPYIKQ